ncbi:MAG: response regulator [Candidatus Kapabacteria bacterium]|nr:response regulator [Candidatus Kapabacteria bacterium]
MEKKRILVVEDEPQIREDIVTALELSDYIAISAQNGKVAFSLAKQHHPDLVISDIMMPEMDGYELLAALQKDSETSSIPFLFLSAKSQLSEIREGMRLGADDYIAKPFDISDLLSTVKVRLSKNEKIESHFKQKIEDLRQSIRYSLPHELRTPLNVILGFSDFLKQNLDNSDKEEIKEILEHISSSAKRLNRVMEKYLFYANLEILAANQDEVLRLRENILYSIKSQITEILEAKLFNCKRKDDLKFELNDADVFITREHLVKLIEELVDNAIKYSDLGSRITVIGKKENSHYKISVTDHGRGLSSEQIHNCGEYVQFERRIYEQQGTGLGLAIVKKIIELHNGSFSIDSELGIFTTVTVTLPSL